MPICQASGANADVIFAEENDWGIFQTSPGKWKGLRITPGETLQGTINRFESNELNPIRAVMNTAGGNIRAGGSVNFELAPEGFGTIFKHLLQCVPVTTGSVGAYKHRLKGSNIMPAGGLSIEKRFNDITTFLRYWGCRVDSCSLNFPQEGYVTGTLALVGKGEISDSVAETKLSPWPYGRKAVSISPAAPFSIDEAFVTYSSVIQEGNPLVSTTKVRSGTITINNALDAEGFVIGSRVRECIATNKRSITGSLSVFFANTDFYDKFIAETRTALRFYFQRGSKYIDIVLPRVEFTGEAPKIASPGGLTLNLPFRALYDYNEQTDILVNLANTEASL